MLFFASQKTERFSTSIRVFLSKFISAQQLFLVTLRAKKFGLIKYAFKKGKRINIVKGSNLNENEKLASRPLNFAQGYFKRRYCIFSFFNIKYYSDFFNNCIEGS
jgi:hypothetical protein